MTIFEAISALDRLKPNGYSQDDKVRLLSALDGIVKREIIDSHEGGEGIRFVGYGEATPLDTPLLIPAPYDDVYVRYLEMQIDYLNGEFEKYNNSSDAYNQALSDFEKAYNREHKPTSCGRRFLF